MLHSIQVGSKVLRWSRSCSSAAAARLTLFDRLAAEQRSHQGVVERSVSVVDEEQKC